ncbi:hypothetical protein OG21DRAFT_1503484 [Imleria badia]|nr:hypothetical protein OG21DRAFT_1503484 [Imleria badia]
MNVYVVSSSLSIYPDTTHAPKSIATVSTLLLSSAQLVDMITPGPRSYYLVRLRLSVYFFGTRLILWQGNRGMPRRHPSQGICRSPQRLSDADPQLCQHDCQSFQWSRFSRYHAPPFSDCRIGKASASQTPPRPNAVSLDELGTTSSADPSAPKLPTYVQWTQESTASVGSIIKKTTESLQLVSPKHDSVVSVV